MVRRSAGSDLAEDLVPANPNLKLLFMAGYTADVIAQQGVLAAKVREALDSK